MKNPRRDACDARTWNLDVDAGTRRSHIHRCGNSPVGEPGVGHGQGGRVCYEEVRRTALPVTDGVPCGRQPKCFQGVMHRTPFCALAFRVWKALNICMF